MVDGKARRGAAQAARQLASLRDGRLGQRQAVRVAVGGCERRQHGKFLRGALVVYREWLAALASQTWGCGWWLKTWARHRGTAEGRPLYEGRPILHVADPAMFTADGGPSIAERMALAGKISIRRADNARVSQRGAMGGWDQVRARLQGGRIARIYVFSTCTHLIRTLPALQHDPDRPEDVDTDGEDHGFAAGTVIDGLGRVESVGHRRVALRTLFGSNG